MANTYEPGKSSRPDTAMNLGKKPADHVVIQVNIDPVTLNPVLANPDQQTVYVPQNKHILWECTQKFTVWFDDPDSGRRTSKAGKSLDKGYAFAQELHASDFRYTGMPYEYHIDTDGGTLDPSIIVTKPA
ncbi:MAG: hypothetical protein ACK4E7_15255 [Permianibacter sp.]